ncbi:MAG: LuxR C-terminal-related transcriptional regulator [Terracidiphilus sp.]
MAHNAERQQADVVLLDSLEYLIDSPTLRHRDVLSGVAPRHVLLAMEDDPSHFLRAVRKGAWGYVLQDASAADVVAALRTVAEGQVVCPPQYTRVLFEYIATHTEEMPSSRRRARWGLTRREQQLIPLIQRGLSNKEIADHFHLSEQTVKNHVHRILRKTGASDRLSISEACRGAFPSVSTESSTQSKLEPFRVPS